VTDKRVILLMRSSSYRAHAFKQAAERLGVEIVAGIDIHPDLADYWQVTLGLQFDDPERSAEMIAQYSRQHPVSAVLSIDDSGALIAAKAGVLLGLPHNSPEAAEAARNKFRMRQMFAAGNVPSPKFQLFNVDDDPDRVANQVDYPCVVKPLLLSGSRGVIRANNPRELTTAYRLLVHMLRDMQFDADNLNILVEDFIPGFEVALEGIMDDGQLKVLALFDKPDPLDGPLFEETIYVTPSSLPDTVQGEIAVCAANAAAAVGLHTGPVHAELRVNEHGPWMVEIAGRSIGGLCSRTLTFGLENLSLEELILKQAIGEPITIFNRESQARGVMMVPIPEAGLLKSIEGVDHAESLPGIQSVDITANLNQPLVPLPRGDSYLGFIFASGESPHDVEQVLRQAHGVLQFEIVPLLPIV
jgi:biotin carboxylase